MNKCSIISEIGINHNGSLDIAKKLIDVSVLAGCDYVKFQKRNNKELLSEDQYNAPHPNPINSYGNTYGAHRDYLEFTYEQHIELGKYIKKYLNNYNRTKCLNHS